MALQHNLMTAEAFEDFIHRSENSERRFELINGAIEELSPTELHGLLTMNISSPLWAFNKKHKLGRVTVETRHRVPSDKHNPDISFTSNKNLQAVVKEGAVPHMPDLAVEVQSPRDSEKKMREKAEYYLNNGTSIVWNVMIEEQIDVYRKNANGGIIKETLGMDDTLDGGEVIPGFELHVKDVFDVS